MKKLMIALAAVAMSAGVQAAKVDWAYSGTSADLNYKVYLFQSAISDSYATFDALIDGSISNGTVVKKTVGPKTTYSIPDQTSTIDASASSIYYVLVSGSEAKDYKYGSVNAEAWVYDPEKQQSSPGVLALMSSSFTSSGTIGAVPEPTSGLLILLGVAGLALKRRRA